MKFTTSITLVLLIIVLISSPVLSQRYLPATVVFHSGQTESGTVYHGNWGETPQFFRFKNKAGKEQKYGPEQVKSIEITRKDGHTEHFIGRSVEVNRSPNKLSNLETGPAPRLVKDTVFLQTLLLSDIHLYLLFQDDVPHYFVEKDSLKELIFKQYLREPNDPALMKNNRYRQQLLALTIDCSYLKDQILKSSYSEKPIRNVLLEYNRCKKTPVIYRHRPEKIKINFYLGGGATVHTLLEVEADEVYVLKPVSIIRKDAKVRFTPIAGLLFPVPRTNERFCIKTDVSLRSIDYAYGYQLPQDTVLEEIKLLHLRSHTQVQWNFINRTYKLYLQGGIVNGWVIGDESVLNIGSAGGEYRTVQRKHEFGATVGAGFSFDRFGMEVRYDRGNGYTPSAAISSAGQTLSLFLTCRLF